MVIDDVISTIKEINKRRDYVPVSIKACKDEDEEHQVYLVMVKEWMECQLRRYRIEHGLKAEGD